jgi:hypothetical protein
MKNPKPNNERRRERVKTVDDANADSQILIESLQARINLLESVTERLVQREFYRDLQMFQACGIDTTQNLSADQIRFVRAAESGWLLALSNCEEIMLPSGLLVSLNKTFADRDYGVIVEGALEGEMFSVPTGSLSPSYPRVGSLIIKLEKCSGSPVQIAAINYGFQISFDFVEGEQPMSIGPFPATIDADNPLPAGTYDVEIADLPHQRGNGYGSFGTVWFRIGHSGNRYLHPGKSTGGSIGCAPSHWTDIFQILHRARLNKKTVGTLSVIE